MFESDKPLNTLKCIDNSRNSVLHKMYVSNVGNRLREMQTPSDIDCQRWPWELMQNAKDSISGSTRNSVNVILEINEDSVTFQHDGCPFNGGTYLALLYKYSEGKANNTESTGRFGTGFLTTHSLSKIVKMEGPIIDEDGTICGFEVTMYRDGKNNEDLIEGIRKMEEEKKFWRNKEPKWTKFMYILKTKRNKESSKLGVYNFKINIILTMLFNQKFKTVELKSKESNLIYEKKQEQQKEETNNIEIISYTLKDNDRNELKTRSFLHSKLTEKSKELSEHYDKERFLTVECALEIELEEKKIIYEEKSPCLFCSLPLVGSESHILPIILNSNDFEPSTERQEILLDGVEIKKDEKRNNKEIPTDVGINRYILRKSYELFERIIKYCSENKFNNLHLLTRGLKNVPKVNKYFDKKWYEENYMKDMREILYKFPIIYNSKNELSYIKETFFPIYDKYDEEFTKAYYKLVKELFINVPRYEESIKWSQFLWEKDLENIRVDINALIEKYNDSQHSDEFNNYFIKFIWDYYKELTFEKKVLINQENKYVVYNEKEFAQSKDISEDMINCIEELGNKWRTNHLNIKITSIDLPIKHDIDYAISIIKKSIEMDNEKSYILIRYVKKNNIKRENIYNLSKLLFTEKIGEKYLVEDFKDEIWRESDEFIVDNMILECEKWEKLENIKISIDNYNYLLNFLYEENNKLFNEKKLLPSLKGEFNFLHNLYLEYNINEEIKNGAKKYINLKYDNIILNYNIKIKDLNIRKYCMDDLFEDINKYLNIKDDNNINNFELSQILINYMPDLESNEINDSIIKKHKDIGMIYSKIYKKILKEEIIQTKMNLIWPNIDKYIMKHAQIKISEIKNLNEIEDKNQYIDLLNKYQSYFNFQEYNIIPNSYGNFMKINKLDDYNNIPEDILDGIERIFHKDLKEISVYKGLEIIGINKKTMIDIGEILNSCFEDKISKEGTNFNFKNTYDICKIIIKYIPIKTENKNYQTRLYNLYKIFDKKIDDPIEIDSYENLYSTVNKGIKQFINEKISDCGTVAMTQIYTPDIFELINNNADFLDPYQYKIIPNQIGELKKLSYLLKDEGIFKELKNIVSSLKEYNIKKKLMDIKIKSFIPEKSINNENMKKLINDLISKGIIDISKILELIPIKNNRKQKDIKYLYENLYLKGKKLKETQIDLDESFWDEANKEAMKKCELFFSGNKLLQDINEDEDKAINILETFYIYKQPELNVNMKVKMVPNQYGELCGYNELYEEKELSDNFKAVLKKWFLFDISTNLKHKKLNYKLSREMTINDNIIRSINQGFNEKNPERLKSKAKEFIKFYPKDCDENYVFEFIDCYKALTGVKFDEEEINTSNINIWDKCIKILLEDVLKILNQDENIDKTSKRIKLDENKTLEKLNSFYSIFFKFSTQNKNYSFIPNEKGIYKKIKDIHCNSNIDNEIMKILSLINEKESFEHILIHHKIKLNINHSQKKLEDIAVVIDKNIKKKYNQVDIALQTDKENFNINKKLREACTLLIQQWFKEHQDKIKLFEFTSSHIVDISIKIILDEETREKIENLLINDPNGFKEMIKFNDPNFLLFSDESFINEDDESFLSMISSLDATLDNSSNQGQLNYINNNSDYNFNNSSFNHFIHYFRNIQNNNHFRDIMRMRYTKGVKKYFLAQAYVYEKLLNSHLFSEIQWKNRINENNENEGVLVFLNNSHRYKIKKSDFPYDFIVKTKENELYKISVKNGEKSKNSYLKFSFNSNQWDLFYKEPESIIIAFVSLRNENNPEIYFERNINLNEL